MIPSGGGTPPAEVEVDEALARALLREQHEDLAELPITFFEAGFDNVMFRLGDEAALRMPRRELGARLVLHEQRWLPELATRLPLPIPEPIRMGVPGCGYPWSWSVVRWLPGVCADETPPDSSEAPVLADFLRTLHQPAPDDAPENEYRGCPIQDRRAAVEPRIERLREQTSAITPEVDAAWRAALAAKPATQARWIHGDLHARNTLVENGRLSGIVDWGDITSGDVATDLAGIWALFEAPAARRAAIERYAPDSATLDRARGWAVSFGVLLLDTGLVDHPRHAAMGEHMLRRVAVDLA